MYPFILPSARNESRSRRGRITVALSLLAAATALVVGLAGAASAVTSEARQVDLIGGINGRWVVGADGVATPVGSSPMMARGRTGTVAAASAPLGDGYWTVDGRGQVSVGGATQWYGDLRQLSLNHPIVGMAPTPSGNGYWLVARDGGIFAFGNAGFHGSTGNITLNQPIVGMAPTPSGNGYWLVARDGGIFAFGDAQYHGSLGAHWLNDAIGILATPSGYAIADAGGRIAEFGSSKGGVQADEWTAPRGTNEDAIAAEILERMNQERVTRGLPPLLWDLELALTAKAWSSVMPSSGFHHSDVDATMAAVGDLDRMAENIYRGTLSYADSGSAHLGFMASAEHRHTLLASAYTTAGVGVRCDASGQLWVTVHFAAPTGHAPQGTRVPTPASPVAAPDGQGTSC